MKRTVLLSSTILAIITVLELSQASTALPTSATVKPTVNESVETPFNSNQSTWRRCKGSEAGNYSCPRFVTPTDSEE
ncbi:Osc7112_2153 family protein [Microcoleus sp. herbarium12]|uniref:Osc7112_2153 family protein n=1 Tax=Microcoleus sp. herbarium12 TaxID=3055437 RepID=UPI002FD521A9